MKIEKNANGIVKGFTLDNDVFVSAKHLTEQCIADCPILLRTEQWMVVWEISISI